MNIVEMWESLWAMWQNLTKVDMSWQISAPPFQWMILSTLNKSFLRVHRSSTQLYTGVANCILYLCITCSSLCTHCCSSWPFLFLVLAPEIIFFIKSLMHQSFSQTLLLEFPRMRNHIRKKYFKKSIWSFTYGGFF